MNDVLLKTCPRCAKSLEPGFAARACGLSFITPAKFEEFIFLDEDISQAGLRKLLPWKAEYYRAYLCRACKLYLIDYSEIYSRKQAEGIIESLPPQ